MALIVREGWKLARMRGSHGVYKHPTKPGTIVIARHGRGRDVPLPVALEILRKSGLR